MLVAAGLGTRLEPLTLELPKPAVPVGNRPAGWFGMDHLARAGFRELVVNTHHLAAELRAAFEEHAPAGLQLSFVHEPHILGTGGGVKRAWRPRDGEDFVTWNAKLLFAPDVQAALNRHRESGAIATMVLRPMPTSAAASFAPVLVDAEGRVRAIRGTPAHPTGEGLVPRMYTGVQVLHPRAHADLPGPDRTRHLPWAVPGDEEERVTALHAYGVLDQPRQADLDAAARLAAYVCGTPTAVVNLIDSARQWQATA